MFKANAAHAYLYGEPCSHDNHAARQRQSTSALLRMPNPLGAGIVQAMSGSHPGALGTLARLGGVLVIPFLLIFLGSLWGASFSIAKFAIEGGVPELGYAAWQSLGSALVLLLVLRLRSISLPSGLAAWRFCLVTGLLGITVPNITFYFVISHLPAGLMAVVVTTAPIITYGLALLWAMERTHWLRSLGIALGFVGAMTIVLPDRSLPADLELFWLILAFLTPFCYALSNLYTGRFRPPGQSTLALACGMLIVSGSAQALIMLIMIPPYVPLPPWGLAEGALFTQIAISSLAYVIYFHIVQVAGAVYFSQVGYIVTVSGILWGMLIFGEQHSHWVYAGTALILGGFALVNLGRGKASSRDSRPGKPAK